MNNRSTEQASTATVPRRRPGAQRLLEVASRLFYQQGIQAVGVDTVSAAADVSKRTLYNRFGDKDGLVVAYLRGRDERWWRHWEQVTADLTVPRDKLLTMFEAYESWLQAGDFRGCPFANVAAEIAEPEHPVRAIARQHKASVKACLVELATQAEYRDAEQVAETLFVLLEGATATSAMRGNGSAFAAARSSARRLLD